MYTFFGKIVDLFNKSVDLLNEIARGYFSKIMAFKTK